MDVFVEATRQILGVVVLGPICVVLAYAYWKAVQVNASLWQLRVDDAKQRVADAQADRAQAVQIMERCVTALQQTTAALDAHRETMVELKGAVTELSRTRGK